MQRLIKIITSITSKSKVEYNDTIDISIARYFYRKS